MEAVLDIIIIVIIILFLYVGYKNGFVKTVMSFVSFIAAFFMAHTFSPPLSSYVYSSWIKPNFVSAVSARLEKFLSPSVNLNSLVERDNPPDSFVEMLEGYGVKLPDVQGWINEAVSRGAENLNEYVASNLVEPVAQGISSFLAFSAVFAVSLALLSIVTRLINRAAKLPVLNFLNRTGGLMLGGLYGIGASCIFVLLVYYALPYLAANTPLPAAREVIGETIFFKWFFDRLNDAPINFI